MFNKTADFVKRFLVFREGGQPQPRERPSLHDANPTAGPSMSPPREVRSVESSVVVERNIPNIPVESVGPRPRTFSEDWVLKVEREPSPTSHPIDNSSIELPRVSEDRFQASEFWECSASATPRSFQPVEPPSLEDMADGYNLAEYLGPPPSDGGPPRYGGQPPRSGGGGPPSNSGPEPKPSDNNRFFFLLAVFSISYAIFSWSQEELKNETENRLDQLELEQKKKQADSPAKTEVQPKEGLALAALRQVQAFGQGGLLLFGGLVSGRDTFIRAFHLIALRPLRQVARALVPRFLRVILGPCVGMIARFGILALPLISRILCFFVGLDFLKRLLFIFVNPEFIAPIVPFLDSMVYMVQGFFATPRGVSVAAGFLEKNIKVVSCTLFLGGFYNRIVLLFKEDKERLWSLIYCGIYGISIFVILKDNKFIGILVHNIIQTFPSIQPFAQSPSGQACCLFGSGLLVQQTVGFSQVVTFFYAWLLYSSGLYSYILKANLPFRPPK